MITFVTGGAGFIGSNFVHYLSSKGYKDIVVVDKLSYASNKKNLYPLGYPLEQVDISSKDQLTTLFEKYKPKAIFHFAAETHVDNSINDPDPFIQSNIIGTVNLLNLAVKYEVEKFHHISTDEVYGSLKWYDQSFTEMTAYDPMNPYSASKAASDHFVQAYNNTYGLPTIITNCSNNYGPRQHLEKLIPKTITNILEGKKIPVYGEGENIRDWIYIEDHCEGILNFFNNGKVGEKYNIGGECEVTNNDLVKTIIKMMNASEDLIEYVDDRPGHDLRYSINNAKIRFELDFSPKHSLEEGLLKTIQWYESRRN
tara:strand:- start:1346 stop:2281 length:936 start_codon:yes stop_codon:yes gene_type:complete